MKGSINISVICILLLGFKSVLGQGVYDLEVTDHEGKNVALSKYSGKVTLIVNVASQCGYTDATYKALTRLHDILSYGKHFSVLAFPCNQFGDQEPQEADEIYPAMQEMYGVEFPIFSKISVVGPDASPLFKALIDQSSIVPDWNFYKYLVNGDGEVLDAWGTSTPIEEIFDEIRAAVQEAEEKEEAETRRPIQEEEEATRAEKEEL